MNIIDRFCNKFPRFGIPHLIKFIVFGTGLVYILTHIVNDFTLFDWLSFHPWRIMEGQVWRLISFIFIPMQENPVWFAVTLYVTYMVGTTLERFWGTAKFTLYVLFNLLVLAGSGMLVHFISPAYSGFTIPFISGYFIQTFFIFAFVTMAGDTTFHLNFIIPMRGGLLGLLMGGALLYELFLGRFFPLFYPFNFLPFVLLIPYLLFCGSTLFNLRRRHSAPRPTSKAAIDFHRAKRKVEKTREARAYTRKCEVCGKTDTEYPDMEFRYCSRCEGYHCYCIDHINHHTHVQ